MPEPKMRMEDVTVKTVQEIWDGLVAVKLADKSKMPKDLNDALDEFETQMEAITTEEVKAGGNRAIKAHGKAMDLYEVLPAPGESLVPDEEPDSNEPEQEESVAATAKSKADTKAKTPAKADAKTKTDTKADAKPPAKAKVAPKKDAGPKKPGIVATIQRVLKEAKKTAPTTKLAIHKVLVKEFKDREPAKMMVSVNTVVTPKEVERLWGLKLVVDKSEKPWRYYIGK